MVPGGEWPSLSRADIGRPLERGETFGAAADWDWHKDADGKPCAYVSIDATGTPQQAEGAIRPRTCPV
jgi:hypothetical protein